MTEADWTTLLGLLLFLAQGLRVALFVAMACIGWRLAVGK